MNIHYILFLLSILILLYTIYCIFYSKKPIEGFESLDNCLKQGYPPEFCRRVPLQACLYNCPEGSFKPKKFNGFY